MDTSGAHYHLRKLPRKKSKLCKAIGILISYTDKILFFVIQMYASKNYTEEEMMKYEMILTNDKDYWKNTIAYFIVLYATRKYYSEDRATER